TLSRAARRFGRSRRSNPVIRDFFANRRGSDWWRSQPRSANSAIRHSSTRRTVKTTAAKPGAPVVGFNHNVKYGPRVYHVQTEDSGLPHAHYITHLFVGGNIVASMKSSYVEKAAEPDLPKVVRGLMEQQHKTMLKRLVTGEFDELAER